MRGWEDWSILVRRAGTLAHPTSRPSLPNWPSLQWKNVPDSLLRRAEVSAVDGEFEVTISATGSSAMRSGDLVRAFLGFMAG